MTSDPTGGRPCSTEHCVFFLHHQPTIVASAMDPCPCADAADNGWSRIKAGHWETGGYRHAVWRALVLVRQGSASDRIEQLAWVIGSSMGSLDDPASVVLSYMKLAGGCGKLEHAMRVLVADFWVFQEAKGHHKIAAWPLIHRARRIWLKLCLSSTDFSKWMQATWKAALFYWAAAGEQGEGYCCVAEACLCEFPM